MDKTTRARYKRLLKGAIRMEATTSQKEIKQEITDKYSASDFYDLEIEVLEELGQSQEI